VAKIIELVWDNGTKVVAEVTEPEEGQEGTGRAGRLEKVQQLSQQAFEKAMAQLKPIAQTVMGTLKELNNPSEVAVEFGVKLSAETGVIIASAQAEANFKISLKWKIS
jgi:hypothetical protein